MTALLTAATVEHAFVTPLDRSTGLNVEQALLLANPHTSEADSLVEHLALVRGDSLEERWALSCARRTVERVNRSNATEGLVERTVLTLASGLARDLRGTELNEGVPAQPRSARAISRVLREPLRVLVDPSSRDPEQLLDAALCVGELVASVPELQLRHPAVAYQLGKRKYALLDRALRRRAENARAAALGTPGSRNRGQDADRGPF